MPGSWSRSLRHGIWITSFTRGDRPGQIAPGPVYRVGARARWGFARAGRASAARLGWTCRRPPWELPARSRSLTLGTMSKSRQEVLEESRRKGTVAGVAAVATVALGATIGLPVAVVAAVPTALLSYRWWKHRAANGIKF